MVTLLLKKSYLHKDLKEVKFNDLWNGYGIFTTMRVIGSSAKILFYKTHLDNLRHAEEIYLKLEYGMDHKKLVCQLWQTISANKRQSI